VTYLSGRPGLKSRTLDEISRVIEAEGVTTLWLTAGLFHLMVDEQLEGLSRVEQLLAGGDVLSVRHVEKYLAAISNSEGRLINGYGPTENTTFSCCHVMDGNTRLNGSVPIGPTWGEHGASAPGAPWQFRADQPVYVGCVHVCPESNEK